MTMIYPPVDEIVANYLKMMIDNKGTDWPSHFLKSDDVYCVNPWTHFKNQKPLNLHDGLFLFVNRTEDSGKTDGCEYGCWRIMGQDKLIKSEKNKKILGFKKIYKFCEKQKPRSFLKWWEKEKRRLADKRIWVMEEYRLASKWKHDYVIYKIRLLEPNPLEFMLSNHFRGYNNFI